MVHHVTHPALHLSQTAIELSARDGLGKAAQNEAARLCILLADVEHHPDRDRLLLINRGLRFDRHPLRTMNREAPPGSRPAT